MIVKKMKYHIKLVILLFASLFISPLIAFSSMTDGVIEHLPPNLDLLSNPHWDILVVTVDQIYNDNTTNENPPKGRFLVEEVLRGKIKNKTINLIWRAPNRPYDHEGVAKDSNTTPFDWYSRPLKKEWYKAPLIGPKEGEKLIVFTLEKKDLVSIDAEVVEVYKFSESNRNTVLDNMAPPERKASIQIPLFLIILVIPMISIILYIAPFAQNKNILVIMILSFVQFAIYRIYESGISIYSNIRIDLLLIYPALLASVVTIIAVVLKNWHLKKHLTNK